MKYEKYNNSEEIRIGDVIAFHVTYDEQLNRLNTSEKVIKAYYDRFRPQITVIGICTKVEDNQIEVQNKGICDINVKGAIGLGDKLKVSETPGIATAIKYVEQDETIFGIRSIGKIISLYRDYSIAKILLDIE